MILQYKPKRSPVRLSSNADADLILSKLLESTFSETKRASCEKELASFSGFSPRQFRRIWREIAGEPSGSFVRRVRLERAAGCLLQKNKALREIARESGYVSSEAFSKAFRSHFACSPSEFRQLNEESDCQLPGFLLSQNRSAKLAPHVRVMTAIDNPVTFLYDGPILLAKRLANGVIDWHP